MTFGIIGNGYFGKHYARLLREIDGADLRAIANNWREADSLIKNPEIDCLVIASPASTHFTLVRNGLREKKHILVEKPMTTCLKEAEKLKEIVQQSDRIFMVGHQYLYNDHIKILKEKLGQGILGEIQYVFSEHFYFGPLRHDVGVLWDAIPHSLAIIDYLFGPFKIKKICGSKINFPGSKQDDFVSLEVKIDKGFLLSLVASRFAFPKTRKIIFAGTLGIAIYDELSEEKLKFILCRYPQADFSKKSSVFLNPEECEVLTPKIKTKEPLRNQLDHFLYSIRQNSLPLTDIEHGCRIISMLDSIAKKSRL